MSDSIRTVSPATGAVVFEHPGIGESEIDSMLGRAQTASKSFRTTTVEERIQIVRDALDNLSSMAAEIKHELTTQVGRPIAFTQAEIDTTRKRAEYLLRTAPGALADTDGDAEDGVRRYTSKKPLGVVLIMSAWNYPYLVTINTLIPALLAGNAVILRPSPQTPSVGFRLKAALEAAGLPQDVLQIALSGSLEALKPLMQHPHVRQICFVGSSDNGQKVFRMASSKPVMVNLELGGKDAAYVLGDPSEETTTVGPVVSEAAASIIEGHVDDAINKGAVDATPMNDSFLRAFPRKNYVPPRLLLDMNHTMLAMTVETFGPLIPVCRVRNDEHAVSLINDSRYGLTASIWTKDVSKGLQLADEIETGTVFVNRCDYPSPTRLTIAQDIAWCGWKDSGLGSSLGPQAFDSFTTTKSYHIRNEQR